MFKGF